MTWHPPLGPYGDRITNAPEAQVVANPTAKQSPPPIEIDRIRNGQHPQAVIQNQIAQHANACALYRSKEVFSGDGALHSFDVEAGNTSFGLGDRARWRFAFHTGPYSHALYCVVIMRPPSSGFTNNTYARLDLATNAAGTPAVSSQTFVYGNDPANGTAPGGWSYYKMLTGYIDVVASTDYYATFYDVDYGSILSACVFDMQSLTENNNGYLGLNTTTHTPVTNLQRQLPVDISNALWQHGAAQVWNWSVNDGTAPLTIAVTTKTNIIDGTSTGAPTAATPGATLDMTGKDRASQTSGVPCVLKAFGKMGAAVAGGRVYLVDSANNVVASIVDGWNSTTATWVSTTFNLPATVAKYDLQFASSAGNMFSLYAVSVYEKG